VLRMDPELFAARRVPQLSGLMVRRPPRLADLLARRVPRLARSRA
jgi:hypothetical protein